MATTQQFKVDGMKCQHCVQTTTKAVEALPGYQSSEIDLAAGTLTVVGDIDPAAVCAAVTEAGFPTTVAAS